MTTRGIAVAGLLVTATVTLTACGSGSQKHDPSPPPPAKGNSATATGPASAPAQGDGRATPADGACQLVSTSQVAAALGSAIEAKPTQQSSANGSQCLWIYADGSPASERGESTAVTLIVGKASADTKSKYLDPMRAQGQPIAGLGLPAYGTEGTPEDDGEGDPAQIAVDGGSWTLEVSAMDDELKVAQLVPIAKAALAH
jgi:hypothetical protein